MNKESNKKQKIIEKAAELIHRLGYNNLGISVLLRELGIPKGSFYYFFSSKEELLIEVIRYHLKETEKLFESVTSEGRTIDSIKSFFDIYFGMLIEMKFSFGCPVGNLMSEISDLSENARIELQLWNEYLEEQMSDILVSEKKMSKEQALGFATFILASCEGVIIRARVEKSRKALDCFNEYIFNTLLK